MINNRNMYRSIYIIVIIKIKQVFYYIVYF